MGKRLFRALIASAVLAGTSVVVFMAAPAGAVTVSTEAELQTAFANASETEIALANDVDLTCQGGGDLDRNSATALTVDGNGFTINQVCADERVMEQSGAGSLELDDVTITGGNLSAGNGGGGIFVHGSGAVTVRNSTISGNSAPSTGGGAFNGETINVVDSTISGNFAADFGGAINAVTVTVTNSTVSGNTSDDRAGGISAGTITLTNSTVSDNAANGAASGQHGQGGGLYAFSVALVYSTVAGNTSEGSANIYAETGITSFGSVVALPQGGGVNCTGGAGTTTNGYNFSDDATCNFEASTDHQSAGDPDLGTLADNGGATRTRLPGASSPLLDAIPAGSCKADGASGVTTDQRGITRPQGGTCDIGAVEVAVQGPATTTTTTTTTPGTGTTTTTTTVPGGSSAPTPVEVQPTLTG